MKNKPYTKSASDELNKDGIYVEPVVRKAIKVYLDSMGMNDNKIRISRKELKALVREMLDANSEEVDEAPSTMTRSNFMTASHDQDDDEDAEDSEDLKEFKDWAMDHQGKFDEKRYDLMAKQVYDSWPEHGQEVDWYKVVNMYLKLRSSNLHTEVDRDKLYEKVLSYAEHHYQGNVPPTTVVGATPGMKK